MEFEVCNASSAAAEFAFDLSGMTASTSNGDALGSNRSQEVQQKAGRGNNADGSRSSGCEVEISPRRGVVPAGGSVKCLVRDLAVSTPLRVTCYSVVCTVWLLRFSCITPTGTAVPATKVSSATFVFGGVFP